MPLDPFEGRLQFLDQLRHLSASQSSSLKLAQFALKHRALHEDLYSCILEELAASSLNDKVNIFFFLQTLVEQSERTQFRAYADMIRRDLEKIVADVSPVDSGAANIPPARKVPTHPRFPAARAHGEQVLKDLRDKRLIPEQLYVSAVAILSVREASHSAKHVDVSQAPAKTYFSQEEIKQRMEEDRERHKLLRESIWMIPRDAGPDAEFNMMWETASSFGDDDREYMQEGNVKRGI